MKKSTVILVWGIATGVAGALFHQILYVAMMEDSGLKWIGLLIFIAGLLVGTLQYRKANGGYLSYGKGYVAGLLMTLVNIVISLISLLVDYRFTPI